MRDRGRTNRKRIEDLELRARRTLTGANGGSGGGGGGAGTDTTAFHTGGDSFGADATLGTNDTYNVLIERGGTTVATFTATYLSIASALRLFLGGTAPYFSDSRDILSIVRDENLFSSGIIKNAKVGTGAGAAWTAINDELMEFGLGFASSGYAAGDPVISASEAILGLSKYTGVGGATNGISIHNRCAGYIRFGTSNAEKMRLTAGGVLVIAGTAASGTEVMRVVGPARVDSTIGVNVNPDANYIINLAGTDARIASGGIAGFLGIYSPSSLVSFAANRSVSGTFTDTGKASCNINLIYANGQSDISFYTTTTNNSTPSVTMTITAAKRVGIGTADQTANAKLEVLQETVGNEVLRLGSVATNDDPTDKYFHGRVATTDGTITTLGTFAIPATTTVHLEAKVRARRTGGASGTAEDGAAYVIHATYKNVAGAATLIGSVNTVHSAEDQAAWDCTFTTSSGNVLLRVTGAAANDVTWHSTVIVSQVGT